MKELFRLLVSDRLVRLPLFKAVNAEGGLNANEDPESISWKAPRGSLISSNVFPENVGLS